MKKILLLLFLYPSILYASIGNSDNREYVDWTQYPYNMIVRINGGGTGQYIAPDLILTNMHVVVNSCYDDEVDYIQNQGCKIIDSDGNHYNGKVISTGAKYSINYNRSFVDENSTPAIDWAIIKVSDPKYIKKQWFNMSGAATTGNVHNAGFGYMRIITDEELAIIRKKFVRLVKEKYGLGGNNRKILRDSNFTDLTQELDSVLKISNSDGPEIKPIFQDSAALKASDCQILDVSPGGFFLHTCKSSHGNSGGAIWSGTHNMLGIISTGEDRFDYKIRRNYAVDSKQFHNAAKEAQNIPDTPDQIQYP